MAATARRAAPRAPLAKGGRAGPSIRRTATGGRGGEGRGVGGPTPASDRRRSGFGQEPISAPRRLTRARATPEGGATLVARTGRGRPCTRPTATPAPTIFRPATAQQASARATAPPGAGRTTVAPATTRAASTRAAPTDGSGTDSRARPRRAASRPPLSPSAPTAAPAGEDPGAAIARVAAPTRPAITRSSLGRASTQELSGTGTRKGRHPPTALGRAATRLLAGATGAATAFRGTRRPGTTYRASH